MIHYWYCVFIRCVGGYSLYVILQLLGLFIIAWGLGRVFWGLGGGVQVGGGGVEFLTEKKCSAKKCSWGPKTQKKKKKKKLGGGAKKIFPTKFFFQKCSWGSETHANKNLFFGGGGDFGVFGVPHAPTRGSRGVGKRYTSSYDHDMWSVKILERSGLAVKSYHPETLAAEE